MNKDMNTDSAALPCARWAPLLAAAPGELTAADRAALDRHVLRCPACASVRAEYQRMDALIRGLPAPAGFAEIPPRLARALLIPEEVYQPGIMPEEVYQPGIFDDASPNGHIRTERLSPMHPTSSPPPTIPTTPASRRRSVATVVGAVLAAVVVLAFAFTFLARSQVGTGGGHGQSPTSTPVSTAAPTHTSLNIVGEQAAYLGEDGHLHVVTLNGTQDTTGPKLPGTDFISLPSTGWVDAAASPSGGEIAYVTATNLNNAENNGGDGVAIVTLSTGAIRQVSVPATNIFWSPDGSRLAADDYLSAVNGTTGAIHLINPATGAVTTIHATLGGQPAVVYRIVGWIDADHLAVIGGAGSGTASLSIPSGQKTLSDTAAELSGGPQLQLDVLDVGSGALRYLVYLQSPPDVFISPDGTQIFVAPSTWVNMGYVVDTVTGQIRDLPTISTTFAGAFGSVDNADFGKGGNWASVLAWQPGTHTVALSLAGSGACGEGIGPDEPTPVPLPNCHEQAAGVWLLNLDTDTATSVSRNTYPLAWTVNGGSLLMSSLPAGALGVGPVMTALSPVTAKGATTTLTRHMVVFFGLV